jgi:hypothetical protein
MALKICDLFFQLISWSRQIEIFAYWINKSDESFNYEREQFKRSGWPALSGPSYQIDRRAWLGEKQGYDVSLRLDFANWHEGVKVSRDGAFHLIELRTKRLKTRF